MEVMEDGNLMDKVHILIQRDMSYYKEHQTILQQSICAGVVGGHLDFPLFASFASIKLALWWEDEFLAGFRLSSGFIKKHANTLEHEDIAGEGNHMEIVKTSDPEKFSQLIITSSEQILDHLHALTQEALDHADLSVLTGTIGATSLLKNCIWFYVNKCKQNQPSNEINKELNEILKKFEEMNEAVAERLLDLHCRLLSLYILQDPDCLNWDSQESFFELERGSYTIQMWWLYMKGTKDDLWKTVPPDMARRVFSGMLNEILTILTVRYCQASPSTCRNHLLVNDLANLLFCVMNLLPAICNSLEELIGISISSENKVLRDIHVKCKELFFCFLLRGVPLEILYKTFRKNVDEVPIYKPAIGLTPWVMFGLSHLYLDNPSSIKNVSKLQDNVVVNLEVTILLAQPQPNWCMLLKVLCMKKGSVLSLLLKVAIMKSVADSTNNISRKPKLCQGFLCQGDGSCEVANSNSLGIGSEVFSNLTASLTYILLLVGNSSDISDVLIPAIENEKEWSRYLDKRQIWSQNRPAWLEAILELAKPILPAVVNTVLLAIKTGATMYQAMSIIIGCFIQMWICVGPKLSVVANLLQEALDPGVNPLGGSVLLQIMITSLYSELLERSKETDHCVNFSTDERADSSNKSSETLKHQITRHPCHKQNISVRSFDDIPLSDEMLLLAIAEGICSIDEDDKHTEEIAELLKQADLHLESCKHSNFECFAKVEERHQMREVLTSDILLTDFGKKSLKAIFDFIKYNYEWIFNNLKVDFQPKPANLNLSMPSCDTLLYSMFHVNGKPFDEVLAGKLKPDWKKLFSMPMGLTSEKVWAQISRRPEFKEKNPSSCTSHIHFMTNALKNSLKGN